MADITFKIENLKEFNKNLKRRLKKNEAERRMLKVVNKVKNKVVEKISKRGSGEPYVRYFQGQKIEGTASRPYDPPATFMGELKRSISIEVGKEVDGSVVGKIIASADHAKHLEFGTIKMQPRPFMHPTLEESKDMIKKEFRRKNFLGPKKWA